MVPTAHDLIVAPATPPGRGAVALVRLSGPGALDIVTTLSGRADWEPRRAQRVRLALDDGLLEDALVTRFVAPHSFTGEDLAEIGVHGSPVMVDAVLQACLGCGARLARPGEFTLRAYLNGRLDLLQAEAVADLIDATTAAQARVASAHLAGTLSLEIQRVGDGVAHLRALLEASLDFPDEGFHFVDRSELLDQLNRLRMACAKLLGSAAAGRRLHDGATVVIAGRPNAGKSSLFNALLGRPRAIVTDQPGTTRDLLSEGISFGGVPVTLVDSAGLRETGDAIEREGVSRAEQSIIAADLVLLVVDPLADEQELAAAAALWTRLPEASRLCVLSRQDLMTTAQRPDWVPDEAMVVSAVTGRGISELAELVGQRLGRAQWDGATLTRARHRSLLQECASALTRAAETATAGASEEFVLIDLHDALRALEALRGVETPDEVLATIFGTFCIGK